MTALGAPSHRENIPRIVPTPIIESPSPAVERYVDLILFYRIDCCTANQLRILLVDSFQLLTNLRRIV